MSQNFHQQHGNNIKTEQPETSFIIDNINQNKNSQHNTCQQ